MDARQQILTRMYVVFVMIALLPVLVVLQVLRINIADGDTVTEMVDGQARSVQSLPAFRGSILDRTGRVLAVNTARYELALDPTTEGFDEKQDVFFETLASITRKSVRHFEAKVKRRSSRQYVLLARSIEESQKEEIENLDVPGVILTPKFNRRYNYERTAGHVLGHVNVDLEGIAGVELQYDEYLRGYDGRRVVKRDRLGRISALVGGSVVEPKHGEDIVLTLDITRQSILEEELLRAMRETGANWATGIAMDPHTGAILAMANAPMYNPNKPGRYGVAARRNRAITDQIEPGSTFKLVTATAAIEQGVVSPNTLIDTKLGYDIVGGRPVRDAHGYKKITFAEVIAKSSNIGTAKTAIKLKPTLFYDYARRFGFGHTTWIDLPGEETGNLSHPKTWSRTTHATISFGYEVAVTPLQLLTAYSALANGGVLVQPHVVAERRNLYGETAWVARPDSIRRVFKRETAKAMVPLFEGVVNEGTAKEARIEGLRIAGKTGTARKVVNGRYIGRHRATFVGFFPADNPEVALIIVVDEPRQGGYGGGTVAAPIFRRVAERWIGTFPNVARQLAPPDPLPAPPALPMPNLPDIPTTVTAGQGLAQGFDNALDGAVKGGQSAFRLIQHVLPQSEDESRSEDTETVEADSTIVPVMPDVTGLSSREALSQLMESGFDVQLRGRGRVVEQLPAPGKTVSEKATLVCK